MMRDSELAGLALTLGRDHQMTITLGGETSYCTPDGSHINIARMPTTPLGRLLMTGLVFHEVAHKHHTRGSRPAGLLGELTNIIEDLRVEALLIKERPGTAFDLDAVTQYYAAKGALTPKDLPQALLGLVMAYGRSGVLCQQGLSDLLENCRTMLSGFLGQDFVQTAETLLTKRLAALSSTPESVRLAEELIELLWQQTKQPPPPISTSSPEAQLSDPKNQKTTGTQNKKVHISPPRLDLPREKKHEDPAQQDGCGGRESDRMPPDPIASSSETPVSLLSQTGQRSALPTGPQIREMLVQGTGGFGDLSALMTQELDALATQIPAATLQGIPALPAVGRRSTGGTPLDETQALCACARMGARLRVLLETQKPEPKACGRSGRKLVPHRLVRLALGDPRIFRRRSDQQALNTAVVILLDTSGSMADQVTRNLQRYQIANPAAFALHHTLYGLSGVKVATAAFSNRCYAGPDITLLADFGEKPHSATFNIFPDGGTPTHSALWYARAALLQRPEPRKILCVVTDGYPANREETLAATRRCEKEGIEIAALGIDTEAVGQFWKHHRVIRKVEALPQAMFAVMEERLLQVSR